MFAETFKGLSDWYMLALDKGGYPLVGLLMAVESSIVPLPSEIVIPPAAHIAYTTGKFSMAGLVLAGTIGSWLGATANVLGLTNSRRPLVMKFGKYVFISQAKIEGAEVWAAHYGSMGIFVSRLLPVVRHLIGIPAGIVKMDYMKFSIYTILGSAVWCAVLCYIGVVAGQDEKLLKGEMHRVAIWLVGAVAVLGSLYYFFVHRHMAAARNKGTESAK